MRSRTTNSLRWIMLSLSTLLAGSAFAAPQQQPSTDADQPPAGMQSDDSRSAAFDDGGEHVMATPLPWSQLDQTQRAMLAPLKSQWDRLPPRRQQRIAEHAEHWPELPPERRAQIQQHLAHWAQMTPEQRHEAMRNEPAFQAMPEADRQRVRDAYLRFKALTPEQRKMLMHRFREEHHPHRDMAPKDSSERETPPPH